MYVLYHLLQEKIYADMANLSYYSIERKNYSLKSQSILNNWSNYSIVIIYDDFKIFLFKQMQKGLNIIKSLLEFKYHSYPDINLVGNRTLHTKTL